MARAPFQVLIYPYRKNDIGQFEYALMKRADRGIWQTVAGGGEGQETPIQAARRETFEETGIPATSEFIQLDTVEPIPVTEFKDIHNWDDDIYVIPQYCFGVASQHFQIVISPEHSEYRWLSYKEAHKLIKFDGNKTALWELDKKLKGNGPRG